MSTSASSSSVPVPDQAKAPEPSPPAPKKQKVGPQQNPFYSEQAFVNGGFAFLQEGEGGQVSAFYMSVAEKPQEEAPLPPPPNERDCAIQEPGFFGAFLHSGWLWGRVL